MPWSPPYKAAIFPRGTGLCSLEIRCKSRRSPGPTWRLAPLMQFYWCAICQNHPGVSRFVPLEKHTRGFVCLQSATSDPLQGHFRMGKWQRESLLPLYCNSDLDWALICLILRWRAGLNSCSLYSHWFLSLSPKTRLILSSTVISHDTSPSSFRAFLQKQYEHPIL